MSLQATACAATVQPEPGAEPYPAPADLAWILGWVVVLAVVLLVDWWLWRTGRLTLSQGTGRTARARRWFGGLVFGLLALLGWHLVFGGPL